MNVCIYALNDPITGRTRYVGKSVEGRTAQRLREHIYNSKRGKNHRECWVRSLLARGLKPTLEIIDCVPEIQWEFWEREYVRIYRALFPDLTNGTEGGDGLHNPSEDVRRKIGEGNKGKIRSPEHRLAIQLAQRGKPKSLGHKGKISAALLGRTLSPEHLRKTRRKPIK